MPIRRRELLRRTVQATLAFGTLGVLSPGPVDADDESSASRRLLPIIDTHQHLWDLSRFEPPWLKGAPSVLRRSYVTKDFLQATEGLNVVKAVYMEIDVDPKQQVEEAEHVIELCRSGEHPTVAAVISGRPNTAGFRPYILRWKDSPYVKGVRQVLHASSAPRGLCLEQDFVASMRLLGELDKSFDLCMRPAELGDAVKLVDQCPGTRFIVDHCGNADPKAFLPEDQRGPETAGHEPGQWRRDMAELAKRENVICKISGIVARAPKGKWTSDLLAPVMNHCLDQFGPDRVVFGGDWPVCLLGASYRRWVEALKEVISPRSEDDQRKLLHDNAVRCYRLA